MRRSIVRYILWALIVALILAVQMSKSLSIYGINPDLIMIICILFSLYKGEYKGEIFGFILGITEDIFGDLFGLNAFALAFICYFTSVYKRYIFVSDIVAYLIYIVISTIMKYIIYNVCLLIFRGNWILDGFLILNMIGEIVYNIVMGIAFYYIASFFFRKEEVPF